MHLELYLPVIVPIRQALFKKQNVGGSRTPLASQLTMVQQQADTGQSLLHIQLISKSPAKYLSQPASAPLASNTPSKHSQATPGQHSQAYSAPGSYHHL